ncbi:MAG: cupin domain-containing protein [Bacteroidetes bacterium]|nr:cupin domain-containing protein [Bacteroidota bacterium]
MRDASYWIEHLSLEPHPEGGYFRETYRSGDRIRVEHLPERYAGERAFSTAIYFMLTGDRPSRFHRLASEELWHFHAGCAGTLHIIDAAGTYRSRRIGPNPESGEAFQVLIPHGCWFAAEADDREGYLLVGCTVAPGFDFADFEMGEREALLLRHPEHGDLIRRLT